MKRKKWVITLVALAIVIACSVNAFAVSSVGPRAKIVNNECVLIDNSGLPTTARLDLNPGISLPRAVLRTSITVVAKCLTDQTWRNTYSSWSSKITDIVDDADDGLTSEFGITISPVVLSTVTSTPTDSSDFLKILKKKGLGYTSGGVNRTADVLLGFSAVVETDSSGNRIAGRAKFEEPYCCILDRGSRNAESLQHETGHMYGLARTTNHHCTSNDCVMTSTGWGHINDFCSNCRTYWSQHANTY